MESSLKLNVVKRFKKSTMLDRVLWNVFTIYGDRRLVSALQRCKKKSEIQQEIAKEAVLLTQSGNEDLSLQKIVSWKRFREKFSFVEVRAISQLKPSSS